jgi:aryl-phospho-beta-D-glucosidase BglC (GH1 family)
MLRGTTVFGLLVAACGLLLCAACGEKTAPAACSEGDEGCACYPNKTCNGELVCLSKLCVDPSGGGNDEKDSSPGKLDPKADGGGSVGADGSSPAPGSASSPGPGNSSDPEPGNSSEPVASNSPPDLSQTPVGRHGQLHVSGTQLTDEHGDAVQLKGVSSMWLNWDPVGYSQSLAGLEYMRDHWNLSVIRAAMGIDADGAYLEDAASMKAMLMKVVDNAIAAGVYVIIDWHDHDAPLHRAQAEDFFAEVADKYGDVPNVLYETFNEPLDDVSWSGTVKPYHEAMIATIRERDPDNVIILGSPHWSQDVDVAAGDPVAGDNLMYTVHFYACSHGSVERAKAQAALSSGLPLFVTEWGAADADGGVDGVVCESQAATWLDWLDASGISWAAWKLDGCSDSTCFFKNQNVSRDGDWTASDLNGHAPFVISRMQAGAPVTPGPEPTQAPSTSPTGSGTPPDECTPSGTCAAGDGLDCVDGAEVTRDCSACAILACGTQCCSGIGTLGAITYPDFIEYPELISGFAASASSATLDMTFTSYNQMGAITFALAQEEAIDPYAVVLDLSASGDIYGAVTVSLENGDSGCQYDVAGVGLYSGISNCWGAFEIGGLGLVRQINVRIDSQSSGSAELIVYSIAW